MSQLCVVIKWTAMSCHIGFNIFYINFKKAYTLIWGVSLCDSSLIYLVYFVKSMLKQRYVIGLWTSTLRCNRCNILLLFLQHCTHKNNLWTLPWGCLQVLMRTAFIIMKGPTPHCLFAYFCMICIKHYVLLCFVCMRIWH